MKNKIDCKKARKVLQQIKPDPLGYAFAIAENISDFAHRVSAMVRVAQAYARAGEEEKAEQIVTRMLERVLASKASERKEGNLLRIAKYYISVGMYEKSMACAKYLESSKADLFCYLAEEYARKQQFPLAFKTAHVLKGSLRARAYVRIAQEFLKAGKVKDAQRIASRALALARKMRKQPQNKDYFLQKKVILGDIALIYAESRAYARALAVAGMNDIVGGQKWHAQRVLERCLEVQQKHKRPLFFTLKRLKKFWGKSTSKSLFVEKLKQLGYHREARELAGIGSRALLGLIENLEKLAQLFREDVKVALELINTLIAVGKKAPAKRMVSLLENNRQAKEDFYLSYGLVQAYLRLGDKKKFRHWLGFSWRNISQAASFLGAYYLFDMAKLYAGMGDKNRALQVLLRAEKWIGLNKGKSNTLETKTANMQMEDLAEDYAKIGAFTHALRAARLAFARYAPTYAPSTLIRIYQDAKQYDEALRVIKVFKLGWKLSLLSNDCLNQREYLPAVGLALHISNSNECDQELLGIALAYAQEKVVS